MQLKLKSLEKFLTAGYDDLIEEAVRLELAGIKPTSKENFSCHSVNETGEATVENNMLNPIIARLDKLEFMLSTGEGKSVYQVRKSYKKQGTHSKHMSISRCRKCGSTEHFVRQCLSRYCQSCGEKGHDT